MCVDVSKFIGRYNFIESPPLIEFDILSGDGRATKLRMPISELQIAARLFERAEIDVFLEEQEAWKSALT